MSFKCQIFQTRLTFHNNVFVKNCDVRLIIILCVISVILPVIKCAKLENPQIRLLINDDDLLQEKTNIHEARSAAAAAVQHDNSGEHFNLYRSELKRLSYETIHRILRDENEPSYRREDTELRYYQKRSPSYEESHQLIKRSTSEKEIELNLSHKNLTEFFITAEIQKHLSVVSVLDLSQNYIGQLDITLLNNFTCLSALNLQNNSLTYIPLQPATKLRTLNLNNNLIKTSNLSSNIYLRNLYLSNNLIENLSSIQLPLLKNLESLDISHNSLRNSESSSFFTQRMHNLKHLNLAFNQLASIYRDTFYNLLSLNTLLLARNNISDIDYETFLALPNLQYLDLSFNNLQGKSIRALQGITGLVALNIAFNPNIGPYMQEFVASWSLKELDASGTGLCQIPAALAQSVRSLKLTHNWLKIINCGDLDSYPLLQYLDLSFSHIEHIEDDALGRLEILEILMLDHNKLLKIPFSLPVSLEHLFLQYNEIMEIPQQAFQGLNNLKTLDLSHNKLLYLPDIVLPKLQTLNLQSSEITGISQGIIHSLPKLNDLLLEENPIKCADLLAIAEWASTCRLRVEKDEEGEEAQGEDDNILLKIQSLKNKFVKMHNFYEQFGLNTSYVNYTVLSNLKAPACVQDNLNALQQVESMEKREMEKLKPNPNFNKIIREINSNQSSMSSRPPTAATKISLSEKSLAKHKNMRSDANDRNAVKKERQQIFETLQDKTAVKTINIENPTQTVAPTMLANILNESQQTSYTTPKSFSLNANATTTTAGAGAITKANEGQREAEIVVKPRFTNEVKTFEDDLTANADVDAKTKTNQQHEIASIGNITTKSSSNMTEVVEAISKHTKEHGQEQQQQQQQQQLKDMQHKTTFTKTFQTNKSKKWLKQETALKGGGSRVMTQNKHRNSQDVDAAQFIKSTTTFATSINSEIQATTIATLSSSTFEATAVALATTTMAAEFRQFKQENKRDKVMAEGGEGAGKGDELKEKDVNVVGFERKTNKLQINFDKEKQQQEIKAKTATTKEIKSLATKAHKIMQTKLTETTASKTNDKQMTQITLKNTPPELTVNLENPNKESNEFIYPNTKSPQFTHKIFTTNLPSIQIITTTTKNPTIEEKHEQPATTGINAAELETFKTIESRAEGEGEAESVGTQTIAVTTLITDKDSASNYNKEQITKTMNKTSNILATATIPTISTSSSSIKNNQIAESFDSTTSTTINNIEDQQQPHLLLNMMSNYRQSLRKDVNVKCAQSNINECNSAATRATQTPDELGREPTIEATLEQTTASKTSTENPEAATQATAASTTTTVTHKHEPLQLLVKDRHLIGTPLLMHKGDNLMVTADELILPTNNHNAEHELNNSNSNNNNKERDDLKTNTTANDNKNKHNLETSQTTKLSATTEAVQKNHTKDEQKLNKSTNERTQKDIKLQDSAKPNDLGKIKKPNNETKTKKPSLIMKKMTIVTKQHEENHQHVQEAEPLENEVHVKQFDNSHYQELKPLPANLEKEISATHMAKHSTVNTPINGNGNGNGNVRQPANLFQQPHTFQHEHELLLQQMLQDTHSKLTKSEQWSDLRKTEINENHSGLILLVSSGLFVVLLLGLMHVYRCDMPWRRHSPSHHMRPHQRQNHPLEDDSHSFLSYSEGMQKWHHHTRLVAPYNSPLHNLHVRELQKNSATEKPPTLNFRKPALHHFITLDNSRSLSQSSSTTTTSTASASSSAILDDEAFYIEMTPDSGQFTRTLQSELLPMELLNMAQAQTLDYQDSMGDSQTSMEDECKVHFQKEQRHRPHLTTLPSSLTASATLACSTTPATATTSLTVKPHAQTHTDTVVNRPEISKFDGTRNH